MAANGCSGTDGSSQRTWICLAADICEQLKRNLKLDLGKAAFVGYPEANRLRSRAMRAPYIG